jgi:hypothetical protein
MSGRRSPPRGRAEKPGAECLSRTSCGHHSSIIAPHRSGNIPMRQFGGRTAGLDHVGRVVRGTGPLVNHKGAAAGFGGATPRHTCLARAYAALNTLRKGSLPITSPPARSCTVLAKATSISCSVLACRTWTCTPRMRAADCRSLAMVSAL